MLAAGGALSVGRSATAFGSDTARRLMDATAELCRV